MKSLLIFLAALFPVVAMADHHKKDEKAGAYRHVVIIKNKTRDWLSCEVRTDIDPQPPQSARVGPRNTREVVIRTLAEDDEFIPYGYCRNN